MATRTSDTNAQFDDIFVIKDPRPFLARVGQLTRAVTGADGATFVLRDGDHCFYAEENAIAPLWKGKRFHHRICISGWVMSNKLSALIEDIYLDMRIPLDAYRPTFVQSLAMVPVRPTAPVAAIGSYWASKHAARQEMLGKLEDLAEHVSRALADDNFLDDLRRNVLAD